MVIPPKSLSTFLLDRSREFGVLENKEDDSLSLAIVKRIGRFATSLISVPLVTPYAIFYNTFGILLNGSLALFTGLTEKTFLGKTNEDFVNVLHLNMAYATKDLFLNAVLLGPTSLLYTFDSDLAQKVNSAIDSSFRIMFTSIRTQEEIKEEREKEEAKTLTNVHVEDNRQVHTTINNFNGPIIILAGDQNTLANIDLPKLLQSANPLTAPTQNPQITT